MCVRKFPAEDSKPGTKPERRGMTIPTTHGRQNEHVVSLQIFELQSALLEEDVTEALLHECTLWFRPKHLQDIITERSEAEGICGWPGCRNSLPRLTAARMLNESEGGESERFCRRACAAKTTLLLSSIPSTPPSSRESVLRAASPSLFEKSTKGKKPKCVALAGDKKTYKRARRRDVPPAGKGPEPNNHSGSGGQKKDTTQAEASCANSSTESTTGVDGGGQAPDAAQNTGTTTPGGAFADSAVAASTGKENERVKRGKQVEATEANKPDDESVDAVRDGIAHVSITSAKGADTSKATPPPPPPLAVAAPVVGGISANKADATQSSGVPAAKAVVAAAETETAAAATKGRGSIAEVAPLVPTSEKLSNDWGNVRFGPKSGAGSTVALHASLVAAAVPGVAGSGGRGGTAPAATVKLPAVTDSTASDDAAPGGVGPVLAPSISTMPAQAQQDRNNESHELASVKDPNRKEKPRDDAAKEQHDVAEEATAAVSTLDDCPGTSGSGKKMVSFAAGTKDSPSDTAALAASSSPSRPFVNATTATCGSGESGSGGTVAGANTGGTGVAFCRQGDGGRGRGRGKGRVNVGGSGKVRPTTQKPKAIVGAVMEKIPVVPVPMNVTATGGIGGAEDGTGVDGSGGVGGSGMIEGHLPRIQADLSFRVMPRGYEKMVEKGDDSDGDDQLEVAGIDGSRVRRKREDERQGDDESEGLGETDGEDDDGNDRAIWRETFGEEMPADMAEGPWIDMEAVRDKALREEFASSIGAFPLLWDALSEWVTPATRAVCRAGRAAAAAASTTTAKENITTTPADADATGSKDREVVGDITVEVRTAIAVAEAIEGEARRHARRGSAAGKMVGRAPDDITVTGALRHSSISAMVNVHLSHAERALRAAVGRTGGEGLRAGPGVRGSIQQRNRVREADFRTFVWSDEKMEASPEMAYMKPRAGRWVEADVRSPAAAAAAAAEPRKWEQSLAETSSVAMDTKRDGDEKGRTGTASHFLGETNVWNGTEVGAKGAGGRGREGREGCPVAAAGGAACRRAVAAVIDTFEGARAAEAANLSIAQWKVVPVVLLAALGLGGSGGGCGSGALVSASEGATGAEACVQLCGPEAALSSREFEMLIEMLLLEH